jgi:2-methylcitrate dehydratase PrpD
MDLGAVIAEFAHDLSFEKLPTEAIEITKKLVLDELGVMVVGSASRSVGQLLAPLQAWGGKPEARVLGHGIRLPAHHAAFINGTMGRAFDFDALHEASIVHASAGSVPACLAIAERRGAVTGAQFLTAMAAGMEFMIRLGLSFEESFLHTGRVTSVHHTTFGAALAGAKLLGLSPREIVSALGLAFTQIGGNLQNVVEGTALAQVQQGIAAQTGVLSAILAQSGLVGPERVFQGEFGYFAAYHDNKYANATLTRALGQEFEICDISVKYFPSCFCTHYANDAIIKLRDAEKFKADDIDAINVRVTQGIHNLVCRPIEAKRQPTTTQEALFSLPYTVANVAVHGRLGLEHLTDTAIKDSTVCGLARKVTTIVDQELEERRGNALGSSIVEVRLKNGRQVAQHCDVVKGHPSNPMSFDDCRDKFWDCVRFSGTPFDRDRLEKLVDTVRRLETVDDVSGLCAGFDLVRPGASPPLAA